MAKLISKRAKYAGNISIFIFLFIFSVFMALPFFYSIINSLKPIDELFIFPPRLYVIRPTLSNFQTLFRLISSTWVPSFRYIFNSIFVSLVATSLNVILSSMAAYPMAKYKLRINWFFNLVVVTLLFNAMVLWLPQYIIMSQFKMINTYLAYIIPPIVAPLGLFLMKQFMESVPFTLIESASIDGASQTTIFFRIVMPLVKPAWLTLTVLCFQNVWNQQPFSLVFDEQLKLFNMTLTQIVQAGTARVGAAMAGGVIILLPPLLIFIFTQSKIIETMAHSGIKE